MREVCQLLLLCVLCSQHNILGCEWRVRKLKCVRVCLYVIVDNIGFDLGGRSAPHGMRSCCLDLQPTTKSCDVMHGSSS